MDFNAAAAALPYALVHGDTACRRCGYNLRGLPSAGTCPECGTPVSVSTQGDLLRYSDPTWLATLAKGTTLILWGLLIAVVVALLGGLLAFATGKMPLGPLIGLVGGAVMLYGSWLLTEPDPSGLGEDRMITARRLVRVCLAVSLLQNLTEIAGPALRSLPAAFLMGLVIGGLASIAGVVGYIAQLLYLGGLASRIPDPALVERARMLRWGVGLSLGGMVLFGTVLGVVAGLASGGAFGGPGGTTTGMAAGLGGLVVVGGCLVAVCGVAALVFGILYLSFIRRMGTAFRFQAELARAVQAEASLRSPIPRPPTF